MRRFFRSPMFRVVLVALIPLLGIGRSAAQDYPFEMAKKNPAAMRAWQAITPKTYKNEAWINKLDGTASQMDQVTVHNKLFFRGSACKPHDCGGNSVAFLIAKDGSEAYGQLNSENLSVSGYYFGAPDAETRQLLKAILEN